MDKIKLERVNKLDTEIRLLEKSINKLTALLDDRRKDYDRITVIIHDVGDVIINNVDIIITDKAFGYMITELKNKLYILKSDFSLL